MRLELAFVGLFFASWLVGLLQYFGLMSRAATLNLGLQGLFSLAAAVGWLAGNIYVQRSRGKARELRQRLLLIYWLGPPGILFLIRSMAPVAAQAAAPLAPLYASIVFSIFFVVPVSLRGAFRSSS